MSKIKINEDGTIKIMDVRLSYPHIFTPFQTEEDAAKGKKPKFSGKFIMPESTHGKEIEQLQRHLVQLQKDWFKVRLPGTNLFLKKGEDLAKPEYEGAYVVSASESIAPQVVGKKREPLKESDDLVYGGCIVHVLIRPWKQDNKYGKKINANLIGVQYAGPGERFGQARPDINEHFDAEGGDDSGFDEDGFDD